MPTHCFDCPSARPLARLALAALAALLPALPALSVGGEPDAKRQFRIQLDRPGEKINVGVAYWIELFRDGKSYRCNNKTAFRSGDAIRVHIIPNVDGYAYILLKSGSRGEKAVLFPSNQSGTDNYLVRGRDYALPTSAKLKFDNDPGTETLSLVFSRGQLDSKGLLSGAEEKMVVSTGRSGAKDLVPTRMQLFWDDPAPVIMPEDVAIAPAATAAVAPAAKAASQQANLDDASLVTVVYSKPEGVLSVDVTLEHM